MPRQQVKYCVVDAFTESAFKGNPAAVCLLEEEKDERWLQLVATEFNLSETCFLTRIDLESLNPRFHLRWFTPVAEVELCGHATLAASHFIFSAGLVKANVIEFMTLSGVLTARRVSLPKVSVSSHLNSTDADDDFCIELDFPVVPLVEYASDELSTISQSLNGASIVDIKKTTTEDDLLVVLSSGKTVAELQPMFEEIQKLPCRGLTITGLAPSESGFDIYSRFFCPKLGIKEDPVTGSAHCALAPYWCQKLGKCDLVAYQASPRGGIIKLHLDEKNQRVDAFTDSAFKGNPAAVCLLEEEKDELWLQAVATEFNISQTCFLTRIASDSVSTNPQFGLRWFTPVAEVKLCGHGTLATSHFLFNSGLVDTDVIEFLTLSGILTAKRVPDPKIAISAPLENGNKCHGFSVELTFPALPLSDYDCPENLTKSPSLSSVTTLEIKKTPYDDLFIVLPSGKAVSEYQPQFDEIQKLPGRGLIITGLAPAGSGFDFYSRFFCPKLGIKEDPVCGSAHCALAPYWCQKLGNTELVAYQASPRGGIINLHVDEKNQRVFLRGKSVTVMEGSLLA